MMRFTLLTAVAAHAPAVALFAQVPEYSAPPAPVHWVSDNPFRLYLVRGADTIPGPVRGISVFEETWAPSADGFDVVRASADVGLGNVTRTDTLSVGRNGEVLRINGESDFNDGEWDALLRLPQNHLEVGLEWADTMSHHTDGPHGTGLYEVRRQYHVAREIDSLDVVGYEVEITAEVDFEISMWTDSTAGRYRWFDLAGPMDERFVFDPERGQITRRSWSMLLEGIGGDSDGTTSDTVQAGLQSENSRYRIPATRAAALMSPLPGADSSFTVRGDGVPIFMHTLGRDETRLREGFRRADGLVGTATVDLTDGDPTRWTLRWVDLDSDPRQEVYEVDGDGLLGPAQERLDPPTPDWGVAEHGMVGTLIPSLEALGDAQGVPFSIYRPTPARWDGLTVASRRFGDFVLMALSGDDGSQTALLLNGEGVLLYVEATGMDGSTSVRIPSSPVRQAELQMALTSLQGGN